MKVRGQFTLKAFIASVFFAGVGLACLNFAFSDATGPDYSGADTLLRLVAFASGVVAIGAAIGVLFNSKSVWLIVALMASLTVYLAIAQMSIRD